MDGLSWRPIAEHFWTKTVREAIASLAMWRDRISMEMFTARCHIEVVEAACISLIFDFLANSHISYVLMPDWHGRCVLSAF
jgi:hypothetical protein